MSARQFDAASAPRDGLRRDTLTSSVVFLVVLSCALPLLTFLRGVLFCRWLNPEQLGCWDVALGFMTIAAPIVVFGIPGSFGRYVEHYSQKGQLALFLRRTTLACLALGGVAVSAVLWFAPAFSYLIFAETELTHLVYLLAGGLAAMIAFGFMVELLTALRMFRVVSVLQFIKGVTFAGMGAGLLILWRAKPESIILGHCAACAIPTIIAICWLLPFWRTLRRADDGEYINGEQISYVPQSTFWSRFLPFAIGIWFTNFFTNLFAIVDRYMILHFGNMSSSEALQQVGHYHSSRIVPLLLLAFAEMLSAIVLPHLSRNWEAGRREEVGRQIIFGFKICALVLTAGATAVLLVGPLLFDVGFGGKYDGGLVVLPWTLTYTCWFALYTFMQKYVWCAERIRLCIFALAIGIFANIGLNLLLLPYFGLLGAVLATAASKLLVLVIITALSCKLGMPFDWRIVPLTLLPLTAALGAPAALATVCIVGLALPATQLVLTNDEKRALIAVIRPAWEQVRDRLGI
jgi:O-antigen/teichoic acid export membrane protein